MTKEEALELIDKLIHYEGRKKDGLRGIFDNKFYADDELNSERVRNSFYTVVKFNTNMLSSMFSKEFIDALKDKTALEIFQERKEGRMRYNDDVAIRKAIYLSDEEIHTIENALRKAHA